MKHGSIRAVFDYWNERRGLRPAPERADIEPGAIRHVLADTFILGYEPRAGHPFRIAGTRVCAAFGRELKGEPFAGLWTGASKALVLDLLTVVGRESVGLVASATGDSSVGTLALELALLPLAYRGRTDMRVLGALAPTEAPYWLGTSTLGPLTLGTLRYLTPERPLAPDHSASGAPSVIPDIPAGRIRHRFVVYDGGQS